MGRAQGDERDVGGQKIKNAPASGGGGIAGRRLTKTTTPTRRTATTRPPRRGGGGDRRGRRRLRRGRGGVRPEDGADEEAPGSDGRASGMWTPKPTRGARNRNSEGVAEEDEEDTGAFTERAFIVALSGRPDTTFSASSFTELNPSRRSSGRARRWADGRRPSSRGGSAGAHRAGACGRAVTGSGQDRGVMLPSSSACSTVTEAEPGDARAGPRARASSPCRCTR